MKKLTTIWKLFLITNYFLLIVNGILVLISIVIPLTINDSEISGPLFFAIAFVLVICLICGLNIHIVHKNFPDKPLGKKLKNLLLISRIILLLISTLLFLTSITAISQLFDKKKGVPSIDYFATGYSVFLFLVCLFILVLQFKLPRYLNKKNSGNIDLLIESIGT
jgi:hypothetical protein